MRLLQHEFGIGDEHSNLRYKVSAHREKVDSRLPVFHRNRELTFFYTMISLRRNAFTLRSRTRSFSDTRKNRGGEGFRRSPQKTQRHQTSSIFGQRESGRNKEALRTSSLFLWDRVDDHNLACAEVLIAESLSLDFPSRTLLAEIRAETPAERVVVTISALTIGCLVPSFVTISHILVAVFQHFRSLIAE